MSMDAQAAAEQAVIGSLLLDPARAWEAVDGVLAETDFGDRRYRLAYRLMLEMRSRGDLPNAVTLAEELESRQWDAETGGLTFLVDTTQGPFIPANIESYARIVREKSELRKLAELTASINAMALDPGALSAADLRGRIAAALSETEGGPAGKTYTFLSMDNLATLPPTKWRMKGVLPDKGVGAIFGPSGCGKSFLAMSLAGAIDTGRDWFGHRVNAAPVVYLCLEGQGGLRNRVAAYRTAHGGDSLRGVRFIVESFNILTGDPAALVRAIKGAGLENPVVIIDTLNRAAPGADENSGVDMGRIIEAAHIIQRETDGLVLMVHHSGKDSAKGMRGHSSLHAALDAVIEVKRDGENRKWTLAKAKDGADGIEYGFSLQVHHLGEDEDGDPVTSCTVAPDGAVGTEGTGDGTRDGHLPLGGHATTAVEVLVDLYETHRSNLLASGKDPADAQVSAGEWQAAMRELTKLNRKQAYAGRVEAMKKRYVSSDGLFVRPVPLCTDLYAIGTRRTPAQTVPSRTVLPLGDGTDGYAGTTPETTGDPVPAGTGTEADSWGEF